MSDKDKTFYITTPLYYVNDKPHIGSAYTTLIADFLARYKRKAGYDVFFLTGTDEHGQKIYEAAQKNKQEDNMQQFVDDITSEFKEVWEKLDIRYDYFIRTTDDKHERLVQYLWNKIYENGDIYKGKYEGWYCVSCERYFTEKELLEGNKCPDCGKKVKWFEEKNYFFKLSKYEDKLIDLYENNEDIVKPDFRKNEMISRLKDGLEDISISRTKESLSWGITVPFDKDHVFYVWVDALLNYVTALGYGDENDTNFNKYWPADVHFIGKEINEEVFIEEDRLYAWRERKNTEIEEAIERFFEDKEGIPSRFRELVEESRVTADFNEIKKNEEILKKFSRE